MNPAPNLVLVGPMGSGKSAVGRRLAGRLGLTHVDADHFIVERVGASIPEIFARAGERGFREYERAALEELLAGEGLLVSAGGGTVLREDNRRQMRERSFVVYLQVAPDVQLQRIGQDPNRPLLQTTDPCRTLTELAAVREPLYREVADLCFDTNHLSTADVCLRLGTRLNRHWQCNRTTS
ncbi:MAG: shikimate kinase [Xanthomonadaceae bacterium]|jgi:shikimate kinase|nr:shikimate kinase [Xanthomonadaceae bacterium]